MQASLRQTKKCGKCGEEKDFTEFYKEKKGKDGLRSWCKICKDTATRERREGYLRDGLCYNCGKHPVVRGIVLCESCSEKAAKIRQKRWDLRKYSKKCIRCGKPTSDGRIRCPKCLDSDRVRHLDGRREHNLWVGNYFNNRCYICGLESTDTEIFDGHHVDPSNKLYNVNTLSNYDRDLIVIPELEKCIYTCAICHRRLHAGRFDGIIESGKLKIIPGKKGIEYRRKQNWQTM